MRTSSILTIALLAPAALALAACSSGTSTSSTATKADAAPAAATSLANVNPLKPTTAEVAKFRDLEVKLWDAWNKRLNPADAAPFYSKAPGNLYFDLSPLKFTGWAQYEEVAGKALSGMGGGHATTHINDDFTLIKYGKLAVTAFTFNVDFYTGNSDKPMSMEGRETDVWVEQDDGSWLIAHQHMSVPSK